MNLVVWEHSFLVFAVVNKVICKWFMLLSLEMHLLEGGAEKVWCLMQFD